MAKGAFYPPMEDWLRDAANDARLRELQLCDHENSVTLLRQGRRYISFSNNNYLGLTHHRTVIEASVQAAKAYGAGSGAARLVTGNYRLYDQLEALLATYKGAEAALVFGSGYLTNIGVLPALVGRDDLVVVDRLAHACLLDGIKLSGATMQRFKHNDMDHCRRTLGEHRKNHKKCVIVTETVFSMDGDLAPMAKLRQLADEHNAFLYSDDAHGFGVIKDADALADIRVGTLSKAAGSYGGYVCADQTVIDYVKNHARSFVYTTALPPAVVAASLAALQVMQTDRTRVLRPLVNARYFCELMDLPAAQSAIVPIIIGSSAETLEVAETLQERGFYVAAIRPPTVPKDTARLRLTFCADHSKQHIEDLVIALKECGV